MKKNIFLVLALLKIGIKDINKITTFFILVLIINLLLWVDFVWSISRRRNESQTGERERGFLDDLVRYSSSTLCCVLLMPVTIIKKIPLW